MLIINADDFGRSRLATDRMLSCHDRGTVASTSAMVFMEDSIRAAVLAKETAIDVGLHLNFSERFSAVEDGSALAASQARVMKFLLKGRYASILYHPGLRSDFRFLFQAQLDEFTRLFDRPPSHFDGHHHLHLCANMLVDRILPAGCKVRRNFSFQPGEKGCLNRAYRSMVDRWLTRRCRSTEYLFALPLCVRSGSLRRVMELARTHNVELETHPEDSFDFEWLTSREGFRVASEVRIGTFAQL